MNILEPLKIQFSLQMVLVVFRILNTYVQDFGVVSVVLSD